MYACGSKMALEHTPTLIRMSFVAALSLIAVPHSNFA